MTLQGQGSKSAEYLEKAKAAFRAGQYQNALQFLKLAQKTSSDCEIPYDMGLTYYHLQQLDDAIVAFGSAAACDPSRIDAEKALGDLEAEKGNDNQALTAYLRVLKRQPDDVDTLRAAYQIFLRHELNLKAEPLLKRLVTLRPHDLQARCDLGAVYAATENFGEAEKQFREVLRSDPNNASALLGLGGVLWRTNRNQEALPVLQKAAKLAPNRYEPLFLLGSIYNRTKQYNEAAKALEQASSLNQSDPSVYYQLAQAYAHLGRQTDQERALARFVDLRQQSQSELQAKQEALQLLDQAKPLVDAGNLPAAIKLVEKAAQLYPQDADVLFRLAALYYDTQQYDKARQYCQRALTLSPSNWLYHYLLGLIATGANQLKEAQASLETAVRLNPKAASAYNQLGEVQMKEHHPEQAIESFKRALQIEQKETYQRNLEAAYRAAGHKF